MSTDYGFQATITARPGRGDELVGLLLSGPTSGPASHPGCTVFLICRSAADPDVVHLTEGWTDEEVHAAVFASPEAEAYTARFGDLVATSTYTDQVPVGGKVHLTDATARR